ncbi:MAG TPA: BON domain-containing protein [Ferruginibacter sp.]|nr:BON domain-containing protein [Ferruginibacter sp.]HMP21279.1 BON domain-containing protein [Ferruginibacter sp.]
MKIAHLMLAATLAATISFTGCKPKDADIKTAIDKAIEADAGMNGIVATVNDGTVTLTGECADDACRSKCADAVKNIKGVKAVINNIELPAPPPPPAPVVNAADEILSNALTDALKDIKGITATVKDGVVSLAGEIAKPKWILLKQTLDKLKPKGYELSGLSIK